MSTNNKQLATIFSEIADYLEMDGVPFKPVAYRKTADIIYGLERDVASVYAEGGLKALNSIPSVGEAIAKKIEEFLKTGHVALHVKLKAKTPVDLKGLGMIEGLGPKKIKILYRELGVTDTSSLGKAIGEHRIAGLDGFGPKSEENLRQALEFLKRQKERQPLGKVLPVAELIVGRLRGVPGVERISVAGSVRRKKPTIGDLDILAVSKDPGKVMVVFTSMPEVVKIWGKGKTKSSVRLKQGFDADLRVVPKFSYGAALQYFTGSKEHNIQLRKIAISKGLKLNEYGIYKGDKLIPTETEEKVYETLGLKWVPPEERI